MKQTIAIICDFNAISDNTISSGVGGSETWAIELSKQLSKNNYYVMIFSRESNWYTTDYGVEYIPIQYLEHVISHVKINYTFIFRYIFQHTLDIIKKYINNHQTYWICHDTVAMLDNKNLTLDIIKNDDWLMHNINKFICMSDFGKRCIQHHIPIPDKFFQVIGNGISFDLIPEEINNERDNNFFWSSRYERGLDLFVNKVFPYIKEKYPESKIYVAQYEGHLPDELLNHEDIIFLGKLGKSELYTEMQKHKVYFYPNFYPETFCITVLEAILCGNELVSTFNHGLQTTLSLFKSELLEPTFDFNENVCKNIANNIIEKMENYNDKNRIVIRNIMKTNIMTNYSWENIYQQFKKYILV